MRPTDNNSAEADAINQEMRCRNDGRRPGDYLDHFTSDAPVFIPYHVAARVYAPKRDPEAAKMGILL